MRYYIFLFLLTSSLLSSCQSKKKKKVNDFSPLFSLGKASGTLDNRTINEASGLDASSTNPGKFWTHNDSGGTPELFLIDEHGHYIASVILEGVQNRDWEEIAVGPGPDSTKSYVYVGEIGDNQAVYQYKYIYRFEEPVLEKGKNVIIRSFDKIQFNFSDGVRDAEAFFIDQQTKDLYLFSKREEYIKLYILPFPQRIDTLSVAKALVTLPLTQIVAADYDAATGEVLVKNYDSIYYWKKEGNESIAELLTKKATALPYKREPQGESICFSPQGDGYYTVTEEVKGEKPELLFYKRN
jgi:hypothetical protein